jgi:hypothetical protein
VMLPRLLLVVCAVLPGPSTPDQGSIGGTVVNASDGRLPAGGAEVVLRVKVDDQLAIAAETIADARGRFLFEPLPVDADLQYLPGANRAGVHYPGKSVRLTPERAHASVELAVHDAVAEPNPLVARRHEIVVRSEPGALRVTETIRVDNPTSTSYVGQAVCDGAEPVTLRLAIPSDFERVTFDEEFFGRRFSQADGKLVTGIPWTPGERELTFTYLLRNEQRHRLWARPLDLPCSHVRVSVFTDEPGEVSCNLGPGSSQRRGETTLEFESVGKTLPAGYVVRLEMGCLPVPWMAYGRWLALVALVGLIAGTSMVTIGRGRHKGRQTRTAASSSAG